MDERSFSLNTPPTPQATKTFPPQPPQKSRFVNPPAKTRPPQNVPQTNMMPVQIPVPSKQKELPQQTTAKEIEPPKHDENKVVILGKTYEIKPTKLKYFRNNAVSHYSILKAIPLTELLIYKKGVIEKERSADEIVFDFLVGVFDSEPIARRVYNDMNSEQFQNILSIFGRLNHIEEKEEAAAKKKAAQANH